MTTTTVAFYRTHSTPQQVGIEVRRLVIRLDPTNRQIPVLDLFGNEVKVERVEPSSPFEPSIRRVVIRYPSPSEPLSKLINQPTEVTGSCPHKGIAFRGYQQLQQEEEEKE